MADSADPSQCHLFQGLNADVALIMFTLSAVGGRRDESGRRGGDAV